MITAIIVIAAGILLAILLLNRGKDVYRLANRLVLFALVWGGIYIVFSGNPGGVNPENIVWYALLGALGVFAVGRFMSNLKTIDLSTPTPTEPADHQQDPNKNYF